MAELVTEVAVGHTIHGVSVQRDGGTVMAYSCSCGEIADVDTDTAQEHVDDVTP